MVCSPIGRSTDAASRASPDTSTRRRWCSREEEMVMKRATRGSVSVHVDAPSEPVYALVSEVTRMGEWSPETYRCRWVGTGGPAPGARFKGYNRRGRARWSNTLVVVSAEPGREFSFRRDVLACGVCDWTYRMDPSERGGTLLTESYEVKKPDWRIVNWFNGLLLGVADRDDDLLAGMRTTLARIKAAAEAATNTAPSAHGATHVGQVSDR
jgi:Polyketide cyclase / dehydrase and lipid transport